jgi:oligoribonuclease NrnB/cAMP/cGMP phosphodiesterase (DHH superfamily)
MNKTLVIYHKDCNDGFTAAWSFWTRKGANWTYVGAKDGYPLSVDITGYDVYFLDFSCSRAIIEEMLTKANSITIIDHHKTAEESLKELVHPKLKLIFDQTKSGARLAFEYDIELGYIRNLVILPQLVKYVEDGDLWKFSLKYSKQINAYIHNVDKTFSNWEWLDTHFDNYIDFNNFSNYGDELLIKHNREVEQLLKNKFRYIIANKECWLVNAPSWLASDIGHELAKDNPFGATYYYDGQKYIFSLRSDDNNPEAVDVSKIAKFYEGGGHKNAAGFELESLLILIDPKKSYGGIYG